MVSLSASLKDNCKFDYSVKEIVDRHGSWVKNDKYMILARWNKKKWINDFFAVKCSKRGNDVYKTRVLRRFSGLSALSEKLVFFNPKSRGKKTTKALFTTLTYDTKLCSFQDAWIKIGVQFNKFMAYIRKQFGKISSCRIFESFENGHPHIHCILLFEKSFKVFRDAKGKFRVHEKELIAQGWHSNVDVQAMYSVAGALRYLKKYLLKSISYDEADSKGKKTLALCWTSRKRAFSVSVSFRRKLRDLIRYLHNSNKKTVQITLEGEVLPEEKFHLLAFVSLEVILIKKDVWFTKLDSKQITALDKHLSEHKKFY